MKLTDLFKFKLFERKDTADLAVVNENFQTAEREIDKRLLKTAVQNTNTVTEAGYALDARQANPNVKGSLAELIAALSEMLTSHKSSGDHDSRYYTKTDMNTMLARKADSEHNHDKVYYTKAFVDGLLALENRPYTIITITGTILKRRRMQEWQRQLDMWAYMNRRLRWQRAGNFTRQFQVRIRMGDIFIL